MNQVINHLVLLFEMEYFSFRAMQVCLLATYNDSLGGFVSVCIRHSSSNNQQLKKAKMRQKKVGKMARACCVWRFFALSQNTALFLTEVLISSFCCISLIAQEKKKDWNCGMTTDWHIIITKPTNYHFKFKVSETFSEKLSWVFWGFFCGFDALITSCTTKPEWHRALKRGSSAQDQGWCGYTIM